MLIDNCIPVAPWRGPVAIVCGGPSLSLIQVRELGIARAKNKIRVIAVNDAIYPCFFADVLHACDANWWKMHEGIDTFYRGPKTSLEKSFKDVRVLTKTGDVGFDPEPGKIRSGGSSGYQAIHIAAKIWQPRAIILVALDYSGESARDHWWGRYTGPMDKHSNMPNRRRDIRILTDELISKGIRFFNASRQSTIDWLPQVSLEQPGWENL